MSTRAPRIRAASPRLTGRVRRLDDSGSASVWAAGITALLLVALLLVALVIDLLAARSRASAAADLAALAGAPGAAAAASTACLAAESVATANGAALTSCDVASGEIRVRATVTLRGPWRAWMALLADVDSVTVPARAGMR